MKPLSTRVTVKNDEELKIVLDRINKSYSVEEQRLRIERIKPNMDFSHIKLLNRNDWLLKKSTDLFSSEISTFLVIPTVFNFFYHLSSLICCLGRH